MELKRDTGSHCPTYYSTGYDCAGCEQCQDRRAGDVLGGVKPVAVFDGWVDEGDAVWPRIKWLGRDLPVGTELFAQPAAALDSRAQPAGTLTNEQIDRACDGIYLTDYPSQREFERAIARAVLAVRAQPAANRKPQEGDKIRLRGVMVTEVSRDDGKTWVRISETTMKRDDIAQPVAAGELPPCLDTDKPYAVVVDRRDLFDALRNAWREGQDHSGEMAETERWERATNYANAEIKGWETLRHLYGQQCAASRPAGGVTDLAAIRDALMTVDAQLVAILNGADGSVYNKLKAARNDLVRVWLPLGRPAATLVASAATEVRNNVPGSQHNACRIIEQQLRERIATLETALAASAALPAAEIVRQYRVKGSTWWSQAATEEAHNALLDPSVADQYEFRTLKVVAQPVDGGQEAK